MTVCTLKSERRELILGRISLIEGLNDVSLESLNVFPLYGFRAMGCERIIRAEILDIRFY